MIELGFPIEYSTTSLNGEDVPEKRLKHRVSALSTRRCHGSDGVENDGLYLIVGAEEPDHGLGHHLHLGRGRAVVVQLRGRHHHRGVARLQQRLGAPAIFKRARSTDYLKSKFSEVRPKKH